MLESSCAVELFAISMADLKDLMSAVGDHTNLGCFYISDGGARFDSYKWHEPSFKSKWNSYPGWNRSHKEWRPLSMDWYTLLYFGCSRYFANVNHASKVGGHKREAYKYHWFWEAECKWISEVSKKYAEHNFLGTFSNPHGSMLKLDFAGVLSVLHFPKLLLTQCLFWWSVHLMSFW